MSNEATKVPEVKLVAHTQYVKNGSSFMPTSDINLDIHKDLPPGNFLIKVDQYGKMYFDQIEDFALPGKLYGDIEKRANRILNTYADRTSSTGVLLSGEKGSGKTLLSKMLAIMGKALGYPTIIINCPYTGDKFNTIIQGIQQPCIVIFDEFEKVYNRQAQEEILTLLDGVFPTKKLFLFTVNDKYALNSFMNNRPGRIFYAINYEGITTEFVRAYCEDNLKNKTFIDMVCQVGCMFQAFNFDMLKALVEDMNRYDESPQEVLQYLNASPEYEVSMSEYDVALFLANGEQVLTQNLRTKSIKTNPLKPRDEVIWINFFTETPTEDEVEEVEAEPGLPALTSYVSGKTYREDTYEGFAASDIVSMNADQGIYTLKNASGYVCILTKKKVAPFSYGKYLPSTV